MRGNTYLDLIRNSFLEYFKRNLIAAGEQSVNNQSYLLCGLTINYIWCSLKAWNNNVSIILVALGQYINQGLRFTYFVRSHVGFDPRSLQRKLSLIPIKLFMQIYIQSGYLSEYIQNHSCLWHFLRYCTVFWPALN